MLLLVERAVAASARGATAACFGSGAWSGHLLDVELHLIEHEQEHLIDRGSRLRGDQVTSQGT